MTESETSSMVLTKMKEISEAFLGQQVKDADVTVPGGSLGFLAPVADANISQRSTHLTKATTNLTSILSALVENPTTKVTIATPIKSLTIVITMATIAVTAILATTTLSNSWQISHRRLRPYSRVQNTNHNILPKIRPFRPQHRNNINFACIISPFRGTHKVLLDLPCFRPPVRLGFQSLRRLTGIAVRSNTIGIVALRLQLQVRHQAVHPLRADIRANNVHRGFETTECLQLQQSEKSAALVHLRPFFTSTSLKSLCLGRDCPPASTKPLTPTGLGVFREESDPPRLWFIAEGGHLY